jgi:hypothetical protein
LAGNAAATNRFLRSTGTGTVAQAPSWAAIAAADLTGLAASATTDTTNASNITSGTLPSARLSGVYSSVTGVGTITNGTWQANPIGAIYGGTGLNTVSSGDLLVGSASNTWGRLSSNSSGSVRYLSSSSSQIPTWRDLSASDIASGTLGLAYGGTGATSAAAARSMLGAAGTGTNTFSGSQTATGFGITGGLNIGTTSITFAGAQESVFTQTNEVNIAAGGASRFRVGATEAVFTVAVTGPSFGPSDSRLKDGITPVSNALTRVLQYEPVEFTWKPSAPWADGGVPHAGFVAQQVQQVSGTAVRQSSSGYLSIDPMTIIADLVGAIQALEARLAAVEAQ